MMPEMAGVKIEFAQMGIGNALAQRLLAVPLNQREYSWKEEHAKALFEDLNGAFTAGKSYFLGTIVLTRTGDGGALEVADGQQRLATTTMLLAAIRDYMLLHGSDGRAETIEHDYLFKRNVITEEIDPRLTLNVDDKGFFVKAVLARPDARHGVVPTRASHEKIQAAFEAAQTYVAKTVEAFKTEDRANRLAGWVVFIAEGAEVIQLTVPDDQDAFMMFETLNDRGLRASQADLLKNYLLSKAGSTKVTDAQHRWARMLGTIEALDAPDMPVTYLRHLVICQAGPTRERELFGIVKTKANSSAKAMAFLEGVETNASTYAAIFNPEHVFWNAHPTVREPVRTLLTLKVEQLRPLLLATMQRFEAAELKLAFRLFVSWSVRFLVAGGGRGGVLDTNYGKLAYEVSDGKAATAAALVKAMTGIAPSDSVFEEAFAKARVSRNEVARYYLRTLEMKKSGITDAENEPTQGPSVNLEHILPETPGAGWALAPETAEAYFNRIGNLVLLKAKVNTAIGNKAFVDKRVAFKESAYLLTKEVAKKVTWGPDEIEARQSALAKIAVAAWPLKVSP